MAKCTSAIGFLIYLIIGFVWASEDGRIYFDEENVKRWNTPPKLIPNSNKHRINIYDIGSNAPQARYIPFTANFTLNSGDNNAHSLSVGGTNDGISLSQSQSTSSTTFNLSSSQSSSFAAGLSGISASEANAFNLNHPIFGNRAETNTNAFSFGQASSSAQGNVINNHAITGAQSNTGSHNNHSLSSSGASSAAGNYNGAFDAVANSNHDKIHDNKKSPWTNIRPNYEFESLYNPSIKPQSSQRPHQTWNKNSEKKQLSGDWSPHQIGDSSLKISTVSATSGSSSTSSNGFAFGQSISQSKWGPDGPVSFTNNQVQTLGNAQSNAQGSSASVGHNTNEKTQASFSSGTIFGNSMNNGHSYGISMSNNRGENSQGDIISHSVGISSVQGTSNAGSVSLIKFPVDSNGQNIHREFIRTSQLSRGEKNIRQNRQKKQRDPFNRFITDFTGTFIDLFNH